MIDFWIYPVLLIGGLLTGFINSIAGGGGLISVPILLSIGLPPQIALGTNKLQASLGSFTASSYHVSKDVVSLKKISFGILMTAIGSISGAIIVQLVSNKFLDFLIPILLFFVLVFTLINPKFGIDDVAGKLKEKNFYFIFGFLLGFYDGFFGPGVGSLWAICFSFFLGYNFSKSTSHTSVVNFVSNVIALIIFLIGGKVLFIPGLIMGVGQIIGSRFGAKMVVKKGAQFVKPFLILMVTFTILRLVWKNL